MNKLVLPAIINPPTIRKDGSIKLSFDSRELSAEEYMIVMGFRNTEGWLAFQPNEEGVPEIPETNAEIDEKSPSERLRAVLFVWYKQETESGKFVGLYETFRKEKMEKIIETIKSKLV
jgi:hypothetical protein